MAGIQGKRVLIVEDNCLIGEIIAETIFEAGGCPLGPVLSEREALDLIDYNPGVPDAAILDVQLDGLSFDVATRLQDLGVPFIFASGHRGEVPSHLRDVRICSKPYTARELLAALEQAINATF
jgi:DNA-binding response OmpR family regulator